MFRLGTGSACEPAVTVSVAVNRTYSRSHKELALSPLLLRGQSPLQTLSRTIPRNLDGGRCLFFQVIVVAALAAMACSSPRLEIRAENVALIEQIKCQELHHSD